MVLHCELIVHSMGEETLGEKGERARRDKREDT
jgi:hypothetical protein